MSTQKTNACLFLAALIWGLAFVAQQMGMDYQEPFSFNGIRFLIGSVILLPVIFYSDRKRKLYLKEVPPLDKKLLLIAGLWCGIPLAFASAVQQIALVYSPAGKVGFLTAMYILVVPILGIFFRKKITPNIWIGVLIAVAGMYLLCMSGGFTLTKGDSFAIFCAFIFALQIMAIDHYSPKTDVLRLACLEFFIASVINLFFAFLLETPTLSGISHAILPLLYTGVLSSGVAYTLQVVAQKYAQPTIAALLMSLESVFSVLGGWLILHQNLSLRETFGCVLMFAAIILAQLPEKKAKD